MNLEDRFLRGFLAGVIASLIQNTVNLFSYHVLNYAKKRYLDFASEMLLGRMPETLFEAIFAQISQILFSGFLGVLFAYLLVSINTKNYLFKGWLYAIILWFFIYASGIAFKIPSLHKVAIQTAVSNFIGTTIYGLVLAETLHRLDKKLRES